MGGDGSFDRRGAAAAFIAPGTETHLDLVITGGDEDALRQITVQAFSTNQPHTRAPFSNMLPDFLVVGDEFEWQGHGGILAAGFFGPDWEPVGAYLRC